MKTNKGIKALGIVLSAMVVITPMSDLYGALNVPISRSVTVEATVSAVNILNVAVKNISDDLAASKMTFSSTTGIGTASQYVQIDFDSNAVGARIVIRTDNKNNSKPFTGTGEGAGLVGITDSKFTVPLLWAVFDDLGGPNGAKAFVFKGDTDPSGTSKGSLLGAVERGAGEAEGLVVDKANPNYESTDPNLSPIGYATVSSVAGTVGGLGNFPTDEDGSGPKTGLRSCTSPIFVVLGAGFVGVPAQAYSTNTLALDLIVQ